MEQLVPILVPAWAIIVFTLWMLVCAAEHCINVWLYFLNKKLDRRQATTTATTGCPACAEWSVRYAADFCGTCGADLQNK